MVLRLQLLDYFAISEGKRFPQDASRALISTESIPDQSTVLVKRSTFPSPIQTLATNSCCASFQGTTLPERTTFTVRASSTRRLEDENCLESECTWHSSREKKKSGNVQQYSSSV